MNRGLALALLLAASCASSAPEPEPEQCGAGVARSALAAVDRKIVGAGAPYAADFTLRARDAELRASQRERRKVAWDAVAKVLADVPLAEPLTGRPRPVAAIPVWQTWYDATELKRLFHRLYGDLTNEERESRARLSETALDDAFLWNVGAVDELPNWPAERYAEYVRAVDTAGEVAGLGGLSRVTYSPAAARHLLSSYPEILACREGGAPPAIADGPIEEVEIARAEVDAASCLTSAVGSYSVGPGETLRARLEEGDGASLDLRGGGASCTAPAGEWCELTGPATVEIAVTAGSSPVRSAVAVTRTGPTPAWAGCIDGPFPADAAVIKADYRRADFEMNVPVYATSAPALAARMTGDVSWEVADGEANPGPHEIHTLVVPAGPRYRLAALHLMTKELDHWLWITLWWSDTPDEDFGADRPDAIRTLGGPWEHYKMCVVTAFDEGDPRPDGGFDTSHPSLAAALSAVYGGQGAPTWCSNPYIEEGHGNAASNCIGCHQHGGTDILSESILQLPAFGRPALRNNFPSDYSWAVTSGDYLEQIFADEEAYWLGAP